MQNHNQCPRCGHMAIEHLRTHSYCLECNLDSESSIRYRVKNQLENDFLSCKSFTENEFSEKYRFKDVQK